MHFVSGTTVNDLEKIINEYTTMCPELVPYLGQHVVECGVLTNSLGKFQKKICRNSDFYDKYYGVEYVVNQTPINGESVLGCCYAGDSAIDRPSFEYLKWLDEYYPLNATSIKLNNKCSALNENVVHQDNNCLEGVNEDITQMIELIKSSKVAQENILKEEIHTKKYSH